MPIKIEGYSFLGPFYHTKYFSNDISCVYILINKANQIVYVDQTGNINAIIINHPQKTCWIANGCGDTGLYIYINNDENFRNLLVNLLRAKFSPICT